MALPPPIPLRPADRLETWDEYVARRQSIALWRGIGDFVSGGRLSEFVFAPYRGRPSEFLFGDPCGPYDNGKMRRFATFGEVLAPKPIRGARGKLLAIDEAKDLVPVPITFAGVDWFAAYRDDE